MHRATALAVSAVAGLATVLLPPASPAQAGTYPSANQHKIGKWQGKFWEKYLSLPISQNPLAGNGNPCGMIGKVLVPVAAPGKRPMCTVPRGTRVFVAVWNTECSTVEPPPYFGRTKAELRACAQKAFLDPPDEQSLTVDGVAVPNILDYHGTSGLLSIQLPEDDVLGAAERTTKSVAAGTGVMLRPFRGGTHTIRICLEGAQVGPWAGCRDIIVNVTE